MSNRKLFKRVSPDYVIDAGFTAASITPRTTIKDRRAGMSVTLDVFGPDLNLDFIAHHLKVSGVRTKVANFFLTNSPAVVLEKAISTATTKVNEAVAKRDAILLEVASIEGDSNAQAAISSFMCHIAYKIGVINERTPIRHVLQYPRQDVTVSRLTLDLVSQAAYAAAENVTILSLGKEKMSRGVFAQAVAEIMQPIGFELHRSVSIQRILNDIVIGVRARIDTLSGKDHSSSVPVEWMEHPVVVELASNAVFLSAALAMKSTTLLTLNNDKNTLMREAPVALAALKQSTRYSIMSREEYLSTFGKITITDVTGAPRYFIGWREAHLEPVAQNVSVFTDATYPSKARLVLPGADAATKLVASAMPQKGHAKIGTHIGEYVNMIKHLTETRDPRLFYPNSGSDFGDNMGEVFVMGDDGATFDTDLCWFLADKVYLNTDDTTESGFTLSYMVRPEYKVMPDLNYEAALTAAGEFITNDESLVFLLSRDFVPASQIEARTQLFAEQTMHARVFDLDESRLIDIDQRTSFKFVIGNTTFNGSFKRKEVGMPDMPAQARFVKPVHNEYVAKVIDEVYSAKFALATSAKALASTPLTDEQDVELGLNGSYTAVPQNLASFLEEYAVTTVLDFAQEVGTQYRDLVTALHRVRSLSSLSTEEVITAKGYMQQSQFLALCDLASLQVLFSTLGLPSKSVTSAQSSTAITNVIMSRGSDRSK